MPLIPRKTREFAQNYRKTLVESAVAPKSYIKKPAAIRLHRDAGGRGEAPLFRRSQTTSSVHPGPKILSESAE